jgi:hypothetical protein
LPELTSFAHPRLNIPKIWAIFDQAICVRSCGRAKQHNCLLCLLPYLADLHNLNARCGITGQGLRSPSFPGADSGSRRQPDRLCEPASPCR